MLWDTEECDKFWDQKVKVQGHSGITYAGSVTAEAKALLDVDAELSLCHNYHSTAIRLRPKIDMFIFFARVESRRMEAGARDTS